MARQVEGARDPGLTVAKSCEGIAGFLMARERAAGRCSFPAAECVNRVYYIRPRFSKYSSYRWTKSFWTSGAWQARHLLKSSARGLPSGPKAE